MAKTFEPPQEDENIIGYDAERSPKEWIVENFVTNSEYTQLNKKPIGKKDELKF
ncbi:hypothetical protein IQ255_13140 [Pleurocapsales cyanobacterium LEGE 10410]|nr:hypothetical protein [Pleurocapsales cyanobacterium LEGE 10410]